MSWTSCLAWSGRRVLSVLSWVGWLDCSVGVPSLSCFAGTTNLDAPGIGAALFDLGVLSLLGSSSREPL